MVDAGGSRSIRKCLGMALANLGDTNHGWQLWFPQRVKLQTLWWFRLRDLSIDEMVLVWWFGCCQARRGLAVGFILLRYSVLFTSFIFWFARSRRWFMDKLGTSHANQTSMCLDPHQNWGWGWFKPSYRVKIFLLTVPRRCFFCGSFLLFMFHVALLSCQFITALWSPAGWPLGLLVCEVFLYFCHIFLSLSHMVSWVRCGAWLYQFLIFAFLLTLTRTDDKIDWYAFKLSEGLYKSKWATFADPLQRTGWLIDTTLELSWLCLFTSWLGTSKHCRKRWTIAPYFALKLMFLRQMSRDMRFPTVWYVRPAKPQISLCIRAVWSEPLLVAGIFYGC